MDLPNEPLPTTGLDWEMFETLRHLKLTTLDYLELRLGKNGQPDSYTQNITKQTSKEEIPLSPATS